MPSSYTPLGVEKMVTGEQAGLWGDKTNTNWNIIEQIAGGYITQAVNGTGDTLLAVVDGNTGASLANRVIKLTGTITGNITVSFPLDVENFYFIENGTSGAFTVEVQYTTGSGTSVTFALADKGWKAIYAAADDVTNPNIAEISLSGSGGISWQTVKTNSDSPITSVSGQGYFLNTTAGVITINLPTSPTQGDEIRFIDYAGTWDTNNLTVGRNSHKIQGASADLVVATERAGFGLVYVDVTQGWLLTEK